VSWRWQRSRSLLESDSLKDSVISNGKVRLRNKRLADARNDYTWQTDPELAQLDAASVLTGSFAQYLADYSSVLLYPSSARYQFAIETLEGEHIGNCGCYRIKEAEGEAELGIMIGNRNYWDKGYGTDAVSTLVNYVFCRTKLRRIYLKTLDWNSRAQKCFKKCGFTPCGHLVKNGFNFVLMELRREQWEKWQIKA